VIGPISGAPKPRAPFVHPAEHLVARQIRVVAVVELDVDHREAVFRHRPDPLEPRQAAHRLLERRRDQPLDVERCQARRAGHHHDLVRRDVRDGVDRQKPRLVKPDREEDPGEQQHQNAIADAEPDDSGHQSPAIRSRSRIDLSWKLPVVTTA
jgi:hypothetical protein